MAEKIIQAKVLIRSDTASNWSDINPVLLKNELAYDETNKKFKTGDGTTAWNSLSYVENGSSGGSVELEPIIIDGTIENWDENYSVELNITEENYQQFLKNKTAPVVVGSTTFQVNEIFDDDLVYYYHLYGAYKFIFAIYWSADGSALDDCYFETIGGNGGSTIQIININDLDDCQDVASDLINNPHAYINYENKLWTPIFIDTDNLIYEYITFNSDGTYSIISLNLEAERGMYVVENAPLGGGSGASLEPIKIEGYADFINGEYDLTFTDVNYQQVAQNKTAPIVIGDTTYYPYWYYGVQEDGGIYIYYRNRETTHEEIIAIYWLPNEETYVDDFMCNTAATSETLTLMCTIEGEANMYPSDEYINYLDLSETVQEDFSFDNSKKYLIEIKNYTDIGGTSVKEVFYFDENDNLIPKVCCHWSADTDSLIPIIISGRYDEGNRSMNIQIQSVSGDPLYGVTITIHQIQ